MSKEYKGYSGTRYKYDLNNPADKIAYELDPLAEIQDSINPYIELDRAMGQKYAGTIVGIKPFTNDKDKK